MSVGNQFFRAKHNKHMDHTVFALLDTSLRASEGDIVPGRWSS